MSWKIGLSCVLIAMTLGLAGCAAPPSPKSNLVVVIPADDGHIGAVVVESAAGKTVLDQAYAASGAEPGGKAMQPVQVTAEEVGAIFAPALSAQPIPPQSFLLYFVNDSETLTPESKIAFEQLFREIAKRQAAEIVVTGHTDTMGQASYNDDLSLKRAKAVRQLFLARGLPPDAVIAAGRGERDLLIKTPDQTPEPRNRRVEITVR